MDRQVVGQREQAQQRGSRPIQRLTSHLPQQIRFEEQPLVARRKPWRLPGVEGLFLRQPGDQRVVRGREVRPAVHALREAITACHEPVVHDGTGIWAAGRKVERKRGVIPEEPSDKA